MHEGKFPSGTVQQIPLAYREYAGIAAQPEATLIVFHDLGHGARWQSLFSCEVGDLTVVPAAQSAAGRADPQYAIAIEMERANGRAGQFGRDDKNNIGAFTDALDTAGRRPDPQGPVRLNRQCGDGGNESGRGKK